MHYFMESSLTGSVIFFKKVMILFLIDKSLPWTDFYKITWSRL